MCRSDQSLRGHSLVVVGLIKANVAVQFFPGASQVSFDSDTYILVNTWADEDHQVRFNG